MERRAWRLALAAVLLLLVLVGLVVWRGPDLEGAWSVALTATAVLAVLGLSAAAAVAGLTAVRGPEPDEVVVRVPQSGPPSTAVQPAAGPASRLRAALLVGLASALPVVLVLALSSAAPSGPLSSRAVDAPSERPPGEGGSDVPGDGTSGSGVPSATEAPTPSETSGTAPSETGAPTPSGTGAPTPSGTGAPTPSGTGGSAPSDGAGAGAATGGAPGSSPPAPAPAPAPSAPAPVPPGAAPAPPEGGAGRTPSDTDGADGADSADTCRYEVVAGDSLWQIVETQLGDAATVVEVAAGTVALYEANAAVVGDDPDLILPGQVLGTCR